MNTDFRITCGFVRHFKTKKLMRRLGPEGFYSLLCLWDYAANFRPDGNLAGMTKDDIEICLDWCGKESIVDTLSEIGFLDGEEGKYRVHDWHIHNPWAAEADERSDAGRLSRLARDFPVEAEELRKQGRCGVTKDEYREIKRKSNERRTTVQQP